MNDHEKENEYEEIFKSTRLEPMKNKDEVKNRILRDRLIKSGQLKSVDSCIIRDKLEFATLDPSFDVEEFIKKFI